MASPSLLSLNLSVGLDLVVAFVRAAVCLPGSAVCQAVASESSAKDLLWDALRRDKTDGTQAP